MNDWEQRYQRGETGWDRGNTSPSLTYWLAQQHLQPCRILIPGCGRGHEVLELAAAGFDVTAVDVAPSAVEYLQTALDAANLQAQVIHGDLFHLNLEPFDAVYEQTCLCAIDLAQHADYETWLYQHIKPQGSLFALFMQTGMPDGPPFHCDVKVMRELFDGTRWQWPNDAPILTAHRNGRFELGYQLIRI